MPRKQKSGNSRSTVFSLMVILVLCATVASAATLSNDLVVSRITQSSQIPVTIAPVYAICPAGYDCMTDADAMAQLGTYAKYSGAVCGYKQSTATMAAVVQIPEYCVKKVETPTPSVCPAGCSCMVESAAKDKFGTYIQCSDTPCASAVTGAARINAYCFRQGTTTPGPSCPEGCNCISDTTAKARYGDYTRCSPDICGYEQDQTPKYCIKQGSTTPTCPEGCTCLTDANAKEKYGTYTRCSAEVCGYETSTLTTAAYQVPKYCVKQGSAPTCPAGCACISDEAAKLKGLTARCDNSQTPCGYQSVDATANTAARRIPLYCYNVTITTTVTPQVCPQGCYCLQEPEAKLKFGPGNYTRCTSDICGYDPSATTANGIPKYCFKPTITPTPPVCPQGCTCSTNTTAVEKGLSFCGGKLTSCGYNANQEPLYCFGQVPSPTCVYDYQKNVCTGTCQLGYTCGLLASEKDATGKVTYGVCGCTGQPATACTYDSQKNVCTGTCQSGAACSVVGKNVDEKTGETTVVCGCPQQSSCTYNYDKDACVGSCTTTGDTCQLNTIYRDPTTGKVTYAECHCKGSGETPASCACDAASGSCTGTCADGKACSMTERTTDNAGKVTCTSCGCVDTCVLDANNRCSGTCSDGSQCTSITTRDDSGQLKVSCSCGGVQTGTPVGVATPAPGILEAITSFFSKLFGGK